MIPSQSAPEQEKTTVRQPIVNNFCITFSTVNGSGSATANTTVLRALFRMGIPVSGKNIFPSNIKGMPTWYTIRLSKDGYLARLEKDDIVIAMNPATFAQEQEYLVPGGVLIYADDIKMPISREDIFAYPMPVKQLVKASEAPPNLRDYLANMVYVGVLAYLIDIDLTRIYEALDFHFKGKKKAIDSNYSVIQAAYSWAAEHLKKEDPYKVEPMNGTTGYVMADGNTAGALGALYGGVQFVGWYPITPASSLAEAIVEYAPTLRKDPVTGKETVAIVQSEDELAAIGMSVGAGWGGLRSMTSTSGPGLSLMAEYLGLAYYSEVPVVVWDVQRVGPSTGLPTRSAQNDITFANFISHGDTNYIILIPGSVTECFEMGWKAFDIAERMQTPVLVMSDLDLGMNQWMTKQFEYPDQPMDRGKVLWEEDLEKMLEKTNGEWGRYKDLDGDAIPYRTVPGNRHQRSAYFARGTGHDEKARYSEDPKDWERMLTRIAAKFETAKEYLPKPEVFATPGNKVGVIAYGSVDPAIVEARDLLVKRGLSVDYLRLRAMPFTKEVDEFISNHERIYVVEMNQQGQMKQLLTIKYPEQASKLHSIAHMDGLPLTARYVRDQVCAQEENSK